MKKNVIFLVVDSLSKEYTENYPLEYDNFFEYLDQHSICASNMYSTAPFTESALEGMWNQKSPLDSFWGNRLKPVCENSIFSIFEEAGYEVYFTDRTSVEEYALDYTESDRKKAQRTARSRIVRLLPQIRYYLNKENVHSDSKIAVTNMLDILFDAAFYLDESVIKEAQLYVTDKNAYYDNLKELKESHPIFEILDGINCSDTIQQDSKVYPSISEELLLAQEIADKNRALLVEYNKDISNSDHLVKQNAEGQIYNRCVWSNTNVLPFIRMDYASIPDLDIHRGIADCGIYDFIEKRLKTIRKPYFAYFHEFSFHYPEVFLRSCKNEIGYKDSIRKTINLLPRLKIKNKISVRKALSLIFVSEWLSELVRYLENKGVIKDTYLVITSDHGISNFMYPLDRVYRWMFYKENFHIPFWILGDGIEAQTYDSLCLSKCIVPTLEELCGIKGSDVKSSLFHLDEEYILTEWMNGIPDVEEEYVKFGYRNWKISLTFCVRLNQFFGSGRILTLFDLEKDEKEYHDLSMKPEIPEIRSQVDKAIKVIQKRFLELQKTNLYPEYADELEQMRQNTKIIWLGTDPLPEINQSVINVYGTDSVTDIFFQKYGRSFSVADIVDDMAKDIWYMGKPVRRSLDLTDGKNVMCVIACRNEMDAWLHLYQCGIRKVYVFTGKNSYYGM